MAQNDYAILVGISRYADNALCPLEGPVNDVGLMYDWLVNEQGVPQGNIKKIISNIQPQPPDAPQPSPDSFPPLYKKFEDAFMNIVRKPDRSGYVARADGRLYLYFSGHGFSEKRDRNQHAALYVGNTFIKTGPQDNIYGTYFANWTKSRGLFSEIVLIMDCCRDAEITKVASVPPLPVPAETGIDAKLFQLYAALLGGKAQERPIPSCNNEVHGLLTYAFLDAVKYAAPGNNKASTADIKSYLEQRWGSFCGSQPADSPIPVVPENGEIRFSRGAVTPPLQRFKIKSLQTGDAFDIFDNKFSSIAHVTVNGNEVEIRQIDGTVTTSQIENGIFSIPLFPSYYMAQGGGLRVTFTAGGDDVEL